jgi:beta-N-acetylhexosaminidase
MRSSKRAKGRRRLRAERAPYFNGVPLLRIALSVITAALLAFAAANVWDVYMVPARSWSAGGILAASVIGFAFAAAGRWRHRGVRWAMLALWCAPPVALAAAEATFYWRKHVVLAEIGPQVPLLGRHFMVGYTSIDDVEALAARGFIGGVFVTWHNARGKTTDQLRAEIGRLQDARKTANLPPLVVATDQEGGLVSRLSPPLEQRPPLATLTSLPEGEREAAARAYGLAQGRELAAAGVTVNFAPVLDLPPAHGGGILDRNSHIAQRAISADPGVVAAIGGGYARGLLEAGVTPVLKHFPGLGRADGDTHHFRAYASTPKEELEATDWLPFREVLAASQPMLMVGHMTLTAIDADHPASHSGALIEGIIRRQWGFQGVIVTDDVLMSPIYQYGFCDALTQGFNAGIDIALVAFDMEQFYRAMRCELTAYRAGLLDETRLAESSQRLSKLAPQPAR